MKKTLGSAVIIVSAFVFAFASSCYAEDGGVVELLEIKLTIVKPDGKEERVDIKKSANKIKIGDKIIVKKGKAKKDRNGDKLTDIELFFNDVSNNKVSTNVNKVGKIKIGDEITIKDGFAKPEGGRGC